MKAMIGYPPIPSAKGVPLLSQNRQFQWFNRPTYIYPMVPAYAATMAKEADHEVLWADGVAEKWTPQQFEDKYRAFAPDVFLVEAKTPIIKHYWQVIRRLKEIHPSGMIALCGDHVTALPEESMQNCPVDFVITGGDYDFTFIDLLRAISPESASRTSKSQVSGVRCQVSGNAGLQSFAPSSPSGFRFQVSALPQGVYYRADGTVKHTAPFALTRDLNDLPIIDRDLTRWELYARENGNFRDTPGTYTMVGRDCWWGKCAFCSWTTLYNRWRTQSPGKLLDEIGHILGKYTVREIFDDTGCFPAGAWLREFCQGMISRGYSKRVVLGCNMIPGVLSQELYDLMAQAGFRFVLFGLESADQTTLDRIRKCGKAEDIEDSMRMAKKAGLRPHVTCMVGYPWETREQAKATVDLTRSLFKRGWIDTLQATIVVPYPGTPLFRECREKGWLKTEDWDRYDMREPIMKTPMTDEEIMAVPRNIYRSFLSAGFILRKLRAIRRPSDIAYYAKAALRVLAHLADFRSANQQRS